MFVSPPVPLGVKQRLPRLLSSRRRSVVSPGNGDFGGVEGRIAPGAPGDKEFISPPREYSDRARDEIRRRLLGQRHTNEAELSDQESKLSSVDSGRSSIFSSHSERTCITSLGSEDVDSELCSTGVRKAIWLEEALPRRFDDMYAPEILQDTHNLLPNGRPSFTKRELLDWDLNDIRSLLIVERLRPEWGGQLPEIYLHPQAQAPHAMPHFRLQLLQLEAPDATIIETLVTSDIYMEANLDFDFKLMSARYTVAAARQRHERLVGKNEPVMRLSKPEWRNIIENYVLNLAVEAQCRFDFKDACLRYRHDKKQRQQIKRPNMPPPSTIPAKKPNSTSLLKQALLKGSCQHHGQDPATSNYEPPTLTKEEKSQIWLQCQVKVYRRLNLDWKPDGM